MIQRIASAILGGLLTISATPVLAGAALEAVDVELVIATDVSPSIDPEEAHLQREGIAEAFLNQQVVNAIQSGALGKIGVAYVDFSSREYNKIVINWRVIKDKTTAAAFAEALRKAPATLGRHTSISDALELGQLLLEANTLEGTKRVIDVSGDGPNNWGRDVTLVRDAAVAKGIIINGLPIVDDHGGFGTIPDLDQYFINCVIGGPAAFIIVAKGFDDFARAIRNKLVLEISSETPARAKNPLLMKVATAPPRGGARPPQVESLPRQPARPQNQAVCQNRFGGFGPFNGFDFPPQR